MPRMQGHNSRSFKCKTHERSSCPSTAIPWEMPLVSPVGGLQAVEGLRHPSSHPAFGGPSPSFCTMSTIVCTLHRIASLPRPLPIEPVPLKPRTELEKGGSPP